MKDLKDLFDNLIGEWSLNRTIEHVDLYKVETATGIASFTRKEPDESDCLYYEEKGALSLKESEKPINFRRKYIYRIIGDRLDLILDDGATKGQLFQTLTPQEDKSELKGSEHLCRLDRHNGKHYFQDAFHFYTEYTVEGPKTNLLIKTHFRKVN